MKNIINPTVANAIRDSSKFNVQGTSPIESFNKILKSFKSSSSSRIGLQQLKMHIGTTVMHWNHLIATKGKGETQHCKKPSICFK